MSLKSELEKFIPLIPVINSERKYWFVRTEGGDYYDEFVNGNYIAIGFNQITLYDIMVAEKGNKAGGRALTEHVKFVLPQEKRPGLISSQMVRFTYLIKKGDIVIIPNKSSNILHFGEVMQSHVFLKSGIDKCPYEKRKLVKWIQAESRNKLDAELYKLIFSHNTISDAGEYAGFIDRTLNDLFIKGASTHLVIKVKTKGKINRTTFYDFGEIYKLLDSFCIEENIIVEDFSIKTNVQSPGIMEIMCYGLPITLLAFGLILTALSGGSFGGKLKANKKIGIDIELKHNTPVGIIERIQNGLSKKREDKLKAMIVSKCLDQMKITTPEDLLKMISNSKN